MGAMASWARASSRSLLVWLAIFAGVAGGVGVGAVAGWARTRSALPAFERFSPAADAAVSDQSPSAADVAMLEQIVRASGADASLMIADVAVTVARPDGTEMAIGVVARPGGGNRRPWTGRGGPAGEPGSGRRAHDERVSGR